MQDLCKTDATQETCSTDRAGYTAPTQQDELCGSYRSRIYLPLPERPRSSSGNRLYRSFVRGVHLFSFKSRRGELNSLHGILAHPTSVMALSNRFSEHKTVFSSMASATAVASSSPSPFPLSDNALSLEPLGNSFRPRPTPHRRQNRKGIR